MKSLSWVLVLLALVAGALFLLFSLPSDESRHQAAVNKEAPPTAAASDTKLPMPEQPAQQPVTATNDRTRMEVPAPKEIVAKAAVNATTFSGVVNDSAGRPLSGVKVSVFESDLSDLERVVEISTTEGAKKPLASAETGPDGRFRLADLHFANTPRDGGKIFVNLSFALAGFVASSGLEMLSLIPGTSREAGPFVLYREGKISGRIETAGLRLESARVSAQQEMTGEFATAMNVMGGVVAADGSFEIPGLSPGNWRVRASAKGLLGASSESIPLAEGEKKAGIVLSLREGLSIEGRVTGPSGQPLVGAQIFLTRVFKNLHEMEEHGGFLEGDRSEKNLTDSQGQYLISGLRAGEYALRVKAEGFSETSRSGVQAGSQAVDFRLGERGSIVGSLQDAATSAPVASGKVWAERVREGMMIGLAPGKPSQEATSDAKGGFRLEGLEPGRYRLVIAKEGFAGKSIDEILVESARETTVGSIGLGHGGRLRVSVVDGAEEKGIADASAKLSPVSEETANFSGGRRRMIVVGGPQKPKDIRQARSDAKGIAVFENLPAGRYLLEASHAEKAGAKEEVVMVEGEEQKITLRLSAGASLCGNAFTVEGLPYPSVSLRLVSESGEPRDTISDAEGKYCFRHLSPGKYWVELREESSGMDQMFVNRSGDDAPREGTELVLAEGQDMLFDLRATPKGSLSGVVRQGESPAEGVRVAVSEGDEPVGSFAFGPGNPLNKSNAEGGYRIEKIKPGKYTVSASRPGTAVPVKASLEIRPGENHLDLQIPGGVVEGVVLDAASGKPVAGARVQAEEEVPGKERRQTFSIAISMGDEGDGSVVTAEGGAGEPSKTDAEGKFRLRDMPAGKFRLRVKDVVGYADKEIGGIELGKDEHKQGIEIRLDRGGTVRGKLLDSAGNPVPFGILFLSKKPASGPPKITGTGPDGSFRFDGVIAGEYKLDTGMRGEGGAEVEFAVKAGETVEKELRMAPK